MIYKQFVWVILLAITMETFYKEIMSPFINNEVMYDNMMEQ